MSTIELQVADRFPPGTTVEVHPRVHDSFTAGQTEPVTTVKVQKDGTIKVSGLVEHGPYFLAGEVTEYRPTPRGQEEVKTTRTVGIIASNPAPDPSRVATNDQAAAEAEARAKVLQKASIEVATAPAGGSQIEVPPAAIDTKGVTDDRIEGVKPGTPLASWTATGQAIVVADQEEPGVQKNAETATVRNTSGGTKLRNSSGAAQTRELDKGAKKGRKAKPGTKKSPTRKAKASE